MSTKTMGSPADFHRGRRGAELAARAERHDHHWSAHFGPTPFGLRRPTRGAPYANAAALHVQARGRHGIDAEVDAPGGDG